jgi:AraC-like DNA-binding protein
MYIVAVREPAVAPGDAPAFHPFLERQLTASEGRRWYERMAENVDRVAAGRFDAGDIWELKSAVQPYIWRREPHDAQAMLQALFAAIWDRLAEPWTLERIAADVGYTANYLNDLTRAHTGRTIGSWIADMRMARARTALEHTELPVADIGAACGYDDPAYFSRVFRRAHGVPPMTWRIAARPIDSRYGDVTMPLEYLHEIEVRATLPERAYSFAS